MSIEYPCDVHVKRLPRVRLFDAIADDGPSPPQFVNTAVLLLLVYGTAPEGYETPAILRDAKIFAGPYRDFSREWQVQELREAGQPVG